ncbi:Crp/Fnr family transcriptional regulator [Actibacterium pelagium]|uniref:Crp/Fnr family transcriptional regulator n=1 Tax=Actibacterium pelagium TaxID=2029103 RepID=A0A917AJJ8_9RHOB|nr:Crp/Fnr family transcriptional regulator [Actibacterium pelagium]GGE56761.1 Crp/Fnr family transcriptional regulator [Actibacterium pelagium]
MLQVKKQKVVTLESWIDRFTGLANLPDHLRRFLADRSTVIKVSEGTMIFGPGKSPDHMLLLLEGTVRVQQRSDTGREIVLYRVTAGESCVMTTACLLAHEDYTAEGIAATDVKAAAIPRAVFDDLLARSPEFRSFVFYAYSKRMTDLFMIIDEVAFKRLDIRLAQKILTLADDSGVLKTTHQKLAAELGSAREVVSRQLQEFQRRGWVAQSRGTIEILDRENLQALAEVK